MQLSTIIQAVGWTLVHSLWLGAVAILVTGVVLSVTRNCSPTLRYNTIALVLALLLFAFAFVFAREVLVSASSIRVQQGIATDNYAARMEVINWCDRNMIYFVLPWLVVVLYKLLVTGLGLAYLDRLKRRSAVVTGKWEQNFRSYLLRLNLNCHIELLESSRINVPMVIGCFKPVVLVPAGMFLQLPPHEVEAVLLHELAHIRRNDFFINVLQTIATNIFFFNPAVLWLSSLLKDEREHCCDQYAIDIMQDKDVLVSAMIRFKEVNSLSTVIGFPGASNQLMQRVRRIAFDRSRKLRAVEKLMMFTSCVFLIFVAIGFTMQQMPAPAMVTASNSSHVASYFDVTAFAVASTNQRKAKQTEPIKAVKYPVELGPEQMLVDKLEAELATRNHNLQREDKQEIAQQLEKARVALAVQEDLQRKQHDEARLITKDQLEHQQAFLRDARRQHDEAMRDYERAQRDKEQFRIELQQLKQEKLKLDQQMKALFQVHYN